MNKKQKIKAHDILSDEKFSVEYLTDNTEKKGESDENEISLARIIFDFLTARIKGSWTSEREQTKKRLRKSIRKTDSEKYFIRWVAAAAVLLAVISVWFVRYNLKNETDIVRFAQTLDMTVPDSVTNLVLQDGRKVLIAKEESRIIYDKKGENIVIDSAQKVSQETILEELVFNTLVVPYGKRTQVTLSDGSKVWLNSGSKLVYPASDSKKGKREVFLEGEAVFEVTHSEQRPFFVVTNDFEIEVTGTVFNVSAYADDKTSSAVLASGEIEIGAIQKSFFRKEKLTIKPGTLALFNPGEKSFRQQQVEPKSYLSWREGYFIFKNEPLVNILKKLERYYNITIEIQDARLGNETFSGNLDLKNTSEDVLRVIADATPFLVKRDKEQIIIYLN